MDISSPKRRKSIAVVSSFSGSSPAAQHRRRAHSIAPGDRLAHLAKARRSLAPRKSILKTGSALQAFPFDSPNGSQSMDLTQVQPPRKSLGGGRVSFAKKISVRVIGPPRRREHSSSSVPDSDSPGPEDEPRGEDGVEDDEEQQQPPVLVQNNENDYPGASDRSRRRSSMRMSMGTMADESSPLGANILDNLLGDEDDPNQMDEDDMDVSESPLVRRQLLKRYSLIPNHPAERNPLSTISTSVTIAEEPETNEITSPDADVSMGYSSDPPVEYEHPINKPLRPSLAPHEDPIYQQLLAVAGGTQPTADPDESTNSLEGAYDAQPADDSLISADSSYDAENQTVNMSTVLGRPSLGGRSSLQDESMDLSSVVDFHGENNTWDRRGTMGNVRLSMAADFADDETGSLPVGPRRSSVAGQSLLDQDMDQTEDLTTASAMELTLAPTAHIVTPARDADNIPPSEPEPDPVPVSETEQEPAPEPEPASEQEPTPEQETIPTPEPAQVAEPSPTTPSPVFSLPKAPAPSTSSIPAPTTPKGKPFTRPNIFSRPSMTAARIVSPAKPKQSAAFAPPTSKPSPKKYSTGAVSSSVSPKKRPRPTDDAEAVRPSPLKKQALAKEPPPAQPTRRSSLSTASTAKAASASRRLSTKFSMRRKSIAGENTTDQPPLADPTPNDEVVTTELPPKRPTFSVFREPEPPAATIPTAAATTPPAIIENTRAPMSTVAASPVLPRRTSLIPARRTSVIPQAVASTSKQVLSVQSTLNDRSTETQSNLSDEEETIPEDSTQKWVQNVQETKVGDLEMPSLSIQQFMRLTDIRFMDELSAPRRSSVHPSDLTIRRRRSMGPTVSDNPGDKPEIPLEEYIVAMAINVPRLSLYNRVTEDLTNWIESSKSELAQAESDAAQVMPELFKEFLQADDEGRDEIKQQLLLTRTHKRYLAKQEWYKWKLQWVEHLHDELEAAYKALQKDDQLISEIDAQLDELVPTLEQEYEAINAQLAAEQAEVAEIESCDQDYLNELKAAIAEQSVEVEALHAEVSEDTSKLEWLSKRLKETEEEKQRHLSYIEHCKRTLNVSENSTQEEIIRMEAHLSTLLNLHMMRDLQWGDDFFQFEYASMFLVRIGLSQAKPFPGGTTITSLSNPTNHRKDIYPQLTKYFLRLVAERTNKSHLSIPEVVHQVISMWSKCERIRTQLNFIPIKFPVTITASDSGIEARVMIYFPKAESKAYVTFHISSQCICDWPTSLRDLRWDIEVVYGSIASNTLDQAVRSRLEQATPKDCHGCIFDACVEAFDIYG